MIDFKQAIKDGMPPSQDMIDAIKTDAEDKLKKQIVMLSALVIAIAFVGVFTGIYAIVIAVIVFGYIAVNRTNSYVETIISLQVSPDVDNLTSLFCDYFTVLAAMKREITSAEVEAMKSILKDKAASEVKESIYGGNPKPNEQSKYGKIFSGVYDPDDSVYSISRDEYGIVEKVFPAQHGRSPWMIVGFLDDVKLEYLVDGIDIRTGKLDLLPWGQYCTDYGERQRHPYETEATKNKSFIRSNDNE